MAATATKPEDAPSIDPDELADLTLSREAFPALLARGGPIGVLTEADRLIDELSDPETTLSEDEIKQRGAAAMFLLGVLASTREDAAVREQFESRSMPDRSR